jgi:hypothetical protein
VRDIAASSPEQALIRLLVAFALTNIALATAFIAVRWRKMIAAPIAFPAGRRGA